MSPERSELIEVSVHISSLRSNSSVVYRTAGSEHLSVLCLHSIVTGMRGAPGTGPGKIEVRTWSAPQALFLFVLFVSLGKGRPAGTSRARGTPASLRRRLVVKGGVEADCEAPA
jgi:hypothetical protein